MENENKYEVAEIASPLESDKLVAMAEASEKRVAAVIKIKTMALRVTNEHDWTDQGGKPYLQVSGAEKIARLFGISWRFLGDITRNDEEGGHFSFEVPMEFIISGASIEFRGSRSSKDPFFSRKYGKDIPPSEVDKADVMKAAITNTIGNGISRILGIRNLTWDDLKSANLDPSKITKIDYKKGGEGEQSGKPQMKNPDAPVTEKQMGAIHAMFSKIGVTTDFAKHEKAISILGLQIHPDDYSFKNLTMGDAGKVIDALGKELK